MYMLIMFFGYGDIHKYSPEALEMFVNEGCPVVVFKSLELAEKYARESDLKYQIA